MTTWPAAGQDEVQTRQPTVGLTRFLRENMPTVVPTAQQLTRKAARRKHWPRSHGKH